MPVLPEVPKKLLMKRRDVAKRQVNVKDHAGKNAKKGKNVVIKKIKKRKSNAPKTELCKALH